MKYTISTLALAAALAVGVAAPVLADVTVSASINKTKDVIIRETLSVSKNINFSITVDRTNPDLISAAEAMALVNHTINNNDVDRETNVFAGSDNQQIDRDAAIGGDDDGASVNNNEGVTGVNQDVGAMANQGNVWSVAFAEDDPINPSLFADAQAEVQQLNGVGGTIGVEEPNGNNVDWDNGLVADNDAVQILASIDDSVNSNRGLTGVNQNAGNMNNQANSVAVAAGVFKGTPGVANEFDGAAVALAESALGQTTAFNTVNPDEENNVPIDGTDMSSLITGSVQSNVGVTQVNQATSNMGNQGNVVSVGAAVLGPQL